MSKIFISYKRQDKDIVFPIVEEIKQKTGVDCWIDLEGIESGDQFQNVIIDAIDNADIVIFMLSKNFIAPYKDEKTGKIDLKKQTFPEKEVMYALNEGKRLIPISIDGTAIKDCKWLKFNCGGIDYMEWSNKEQRIKLCQNLYDRFETSEEQNCLKNVVINFTCRNHTKKTMPAVLHSLFVIISWLSVLLLQTVFIFIFFYDGPRSSTWNARLLDASLGHIVKDTFLVPSVVALLTSILFYYPIKINPTKYLVCSDWFRSMANAIAIDFVIYVFSHLGFMASSEFFVKGLIYTILTILFFITYSVILKFNSRFAKNVPF